MRAGLCILGLSCLLLSWSCENDLADVEALQERLNVKVETVKEVEILYSDSAQVKVRVTGPTMLNNLDRTEPFQEFVDGVLVEFFDPEDGSISSTLVARYAIRFERRGEIIARDSVVWESVTDQKLETEELIWQEREQQVFTRKFARISTPTEIIYGHGFRANQDFSNARIQQVEGIITVDQPE
ncbi:MAG: LPS export ABC transporter periplasmic protein LptC [Bacteroidota bacterium]